MVRAAVLATAVGMGVGDNYVLGTVSYGQGLELDERHADVRLGALRPVGRRVHLGLDSRLRLDLEKGADEPAGEAQWDFMGGPTGAVSLGQFALTAMAGASAVKLRAGGPTKVGALVMTGVGSAF
jgi:hypothetical protein